MITTSVLMLMLLSQSDLGVFREIYRKGALYHVCPDALFHGRRENTVRNFPSLG